MKIICIGRNYAAHAAELGNDLPEEPLIFLKPETALLGTGEAFRIPSFSNDVHYELELVLRFGKAGKDISEPDIDEHIEAFSIGLYMTARDVQSQLKAKGKPWEKAKAFDGSAILGDTWKPWSEFDVEQTRFSLEKNGQQVQFGDPGLMLFPIPRLIAHVSRFMSVRPGDMLFIGTPKGVGQVVKGDRLEGFLDEEGMFSVVVD